MNTLRKAMVLLAALALASGCAPKTPATPDGGSHPDGGSPSDGGSTPDGGAAIPNQVTVRAHGAFPHQDQTVTDGWLAYQDGEGAWQQVNGVGGTYQFPVHDAEGRYTFAFHCPNTKNINLYVQTTPERAAWTMTCPIAGSPGPVQLSVVTNSWPTGSYEAEVHVADQRITDTNQGNTDHLSVFPGIYDAFAFTKTASGESWTGASLQHAVDCTSAATFTFPMTVTPVAVPVTISTLGTTAGMTLDVNATFLTAHGTSAQMPIAASASATYDALPSSALEAQDFNLVATDYRATSGDEHGAMAVFNAPPSSLSLVSPPEIMNLTSTADNANGELMPSVTWSGGPQNGAVTLLQVLQLSPVTRQWMMRVSAARLGGPGTVTIPNLTAAPGYDPNNSLDPTQSVIGSLYVMSSTKGGADAYFDYDFEDPHSRNFVDGQTMAFATGSFTWNP